MTRFLAPRPAMASVFILSLGVSPVGAQPFVEGDLYLNHQNAGTPVEAVAPNGTLRSTGIVKEVYGPGDGMVIHDGALYMSSGSAGTVVRYDNASGDPGSYEVVATDLIGPCGLGFDQKSQLFVVENGANRVSRIEMGGERYDHVTDLSSPIDLVFGGDGHMYITEYGAGRVIRVTPSGEIVPLASIDTPTCLAMAADGALYVTEHFGYQVSRITPAGEVSPRAKFSSNPEGLDFDHDGNLAVGLNNGEVHLIPGDGGDPRLLASTGQDVDCLAFFPSCALAVETQGAPATISRGATLSFTAAAVNGCEDGQSFDQAMLVITGPAALTKGLYQGSPIQVAAGSEVSATVRLPVPRGAPLGTYRIEVEISKDGQAVAHAGFDVTVDQ